jgi:glycosyltransferase involved in cell wall biosynthesis
VDKEANVLARAGHEVYLLCRARASEAAEETLGDVRVRRHTVHPDSALKRKADSFVSLITLDSPSWRRAMKRFIEQNGLDALHLHDLPFSATALLAARECGIPCVIDLHENYPAALRLWKRRLIDRIMFSPGRAEHLEREAIGEADRVVVVVDEARERLAGLGCNPDKVTVFGNSEPLSLLDSAPPPPPYRGALHLVYVGGVAAHRGLDTAVEAMPRIVEELPGSTLTIVGDGPSLEGLRVLARRLGVEQSVSLLGRLPFDEAMEHIRAANVALIPHHRSPHTDATVPHKLFQYMALGRPVIVSDCAPLERIVTQTGAGLVFSAGDASSLAARAFQLADQDAIEAAGAAGQTAVANRWNLETEGRALTALYESIDTTARA